MHTCNSNKLNNIQGLYCHRAIFSNNFDAKCASVLTLTQAASRRLKPKLWPSRAARALGSPVVTARWSPLGSGVGATWSSAMRCELGDWERQLGNDLFSLLC